MNLQVRDIWVLALLLPPVWLLGSGHHLCACFLFITAIITAVVRVHWWGLFYSRSVFYPLSHVLLTPQPHELSPVTPILQIRKLRSGAKSLAQPLSQSFRWGWIRSSWILQPTLCPISARWSGVHSGCPALHGTHFMFADCVSSHYSRGSQLLHLPPAAVTHQSILNPWGSGLTWPRRVQACRETCHSVPASLGNISCLLCAKNLVQCKLRSRITKYHC